MRISSFFTGAGGLDLGFKKSGAQILYANEFDKNIWSTFELNFTNKSNTYLDKRSITEVHADDVPDCDGIVGGPPCQSWSEAGALRGIEDKRGQLFYDFIRILKAKQPLFFLAENVSGMLAKRHSNALEGIIKLFEESGYLVSYKLLNVSDYGVPQDRKRVIFVGYRKDLGIKFVHPEPTTPLRDQKKTLRDAIDDLKENVLAGREKNYSNYGQCKVPNHEYMIGGFSTMYMSRNRVRSWDDQSFTIQAGGRHAPIHPQAPKMEFVEKNKRIFVPGKEKLYRRLSVRECARIQTFPDDFIFEYDNIAEGYKMIGNAVPVDFAAILAKQIKKDLNL
tara:strand:+ start:2210 stop:3214 length:1005 start_codon:yes stop_codon:yes gene_type:complete